MADLNLRIYSLKFGGYFNGVVNHVVDLRSDSPPFCDRYLSTSLENAEAFVRGVQVAMVFAGKNVSVDGEFYTGIDLWSAYENNVLIRCSIKWGRAFNEEDYKQGRL